jgi:DNA-binding FadR family transcriptional regulator
MMASSGDARPFPRVGRIAAMPDDTPSSITTLTERLFQQVAEHSGNTLLGEAVRRLNRELTATRAFEADFIPDLEGEYAALSAAWEKRDYQTLRALIKAYFERRRPLLKQNIYLSGRPN